MIPEKCASEKRNVEMRQKIKVSNHSATRLVRSLAETKPTQSRSLFTIRCYGDHAELPNRNLKNPLEVECDYFVMTFSPLEPQPPATITTARPPIVSSNTGKCLSEIFFYWKNYTYLFSPCCRSLVNYSRRSKYYFNNHEHEA